MAGPSPTAQPPAPTDILMQLERSQKMVNRLRDGDAATRRAAKEAFAETVDRTIDSALLRGDPNVTAGIHRERLAKMRASTGRSAKDDSGEIIDRFKKINVGAGPMASWLIGSSKVQPAIRAARVAERLKTELPEEKWAEVRKAVADSIMQGEVDGEPRKAADDFMKFMHGRGERLMATMFSKKERDLMARIGNTVRLQGKQSAPTVKPMLAQLGAMVAPRMKPRTISDIEFDKRFAAGDVPPNYPVDDAALTEGLIRRQQMINSLEGHPGDPVLAGELVLPVAPYRP